MDYEFEQDQPLDALPVRAQPRYQKIVMRGAGRFYLEGTSPTGEPFSVRLGPSDASSDPPSR